MMMTMTKAGNCLPVSYLVSLLCRPQTSPCLIVRALGKSGSGNHHDNHHDHCHLKIKIILMLTLMTIIIDHRYIYFRFHKILMTRPGSSGQPNRCLARGARLVNPDQHHQHHHCHDDSWMDLFILR